MSSQFVPVAIEAVKSAEKVILGYFQKDFTVTTKMDKSPVTQADQEAEEIIKKVISESFPDHTFFGEEGEKVNLENHKGYTWIIDPIDGTKNYIRGIPLFGTLLALLHDGELEVGISNVPVLGELMYAAKGAGAFLNEQQVFVSETENVAESYLSYGRLQYFEDLDCMIELQKLSDQAAWSRGIGDCWSYHLVAQGKVDIMMEGSMKFWDVAAAKVIVEEAGGKMTQLDGQPITFQSTTALATNGILHHEVVAAMKN